MAAAPTKPDLALAAERQAVIAELKPLDPNQAFDVILLDYAEAIVDNPALYPVTLAYLEKHKPPKREWKGREEWLRKKQQ